MRTRLIDHRRHPSYFPYYKLQWWDERNLSWHDVQARYPTEGEALTRGLDHFPPQADPGLRRVVEVQRSGRRPLVS